MRVWAHAMLSRMAGSEEHRELLREAGFGSVQITTETNKEWIFASGRKEGIEGS